MITELQEKGVEVLQKDEWNTTPEIGTFARIHDPEENSIELWETVSKK